MTKSNEYYYAVWRRKSSTATLKLYPQGTGKYTVRTSNWKEQSLRDYFGGNEYLVDIALASFDVLGGTYWKMFDAELVIKWWGLAGQSDAIRLAFSRALIIFDPELRPTLKPHGLLKRDPRIKERKKPGLKKARKGPTRSKR